MSFEGEEYIQTRATISIGETSLVLIPFGKSGMEGAGVLREMFKMGAFDCEANIFQWSTFLKTTILPTFPFLPVRKCVDHSDERLATVAGLVPIRARHCMANRSLGTKSSPYC